MLGHPTWREHKHRLTQPVALPSVRVPIPSLKFGLPFMDNWPIRQDGQELSWQQGAYASHEPSVVTMNDVMLHSHAGIVLYEDRCIAGTLAHTSKQMHHYDTDEGAIVVDVACAQDLRGTYISALAGANANFFHNVIDCVARMSVLTQELRDAADGILVPAECNVVIQLLALAHIDLPLRQVQPSETVRVDRLILPTSVRGHIDYHPCLLGVFDTISGNVPAVENTPHPTRFYIDRRGSWRRKLLNESELIDALIPLGLHVVRLEDYSIADQIRLFRNAEFIVTPHGAGLTNIIYTTPGCRVLELLMDAYVTWVFRHLCAVKGVGYDCVIGPAVDPWPDPGPAVNGLRWIISVPYVVAAVEAILSTSAPRPHQTRA